MHIFHICLNLSSCFSPGWRDTGLKMWTNYSLIHHCRRGSSWYQAKGDRNQRPYLWWQASGFNKHPKITFKLYLHGFENTNHPWFHRSSIYALPLFSVQYFLFFSQHWEINLPLGLPRLHCCIPISGIHFPCCMGTEKF